MNRWSHVKSEGEYAKYCSNNLFTISLVHRERKITGRPNTIVPEPHFDMIRYQRLVFSSLY